MLKGLAPNNGEILFSAGASTREDTVYKLVSTDIICKHVDVEVRGQALKRGTSISHK